MAAVLLLLPWVTSLCIACVALSGGRNLKLLKIPIKVRIQHSLFLIAVVVTSI